MCDTVCNRQAPAAVKNARRARRKASRRASVKGRSNISKRQLYESVTIGRRRRPSKRGGRGARAAAARACRMFRGSRGELRLSSCKSNSSSSSSAPAPRHELVRGQSTVRPRVGRAVRHLRHAHRVLPRAATAWADGRWRDAAGATAAELPLPTERRRCTSSAEAPADAEQLERLTAGECPRGLSAAAGVTSTGLRTPHSERGSTIVDAAAASARHATSALPRRRRVHG